ncbi:hypothetical protein [Leifsonia sp. A12D58]|uniref:hypothetical protein n=1 Tax=Leifsonia sp. A12D58 TaxID=3397674 RepID=UPI0039DF75B8
MPIVQRVTSVAMAEMGRATEEVLATLTGVVVFLVFGGILVGANTPRVTSALELDGTTAQIVMIFAGGVLLSTVIVMIVTLVTSVSRHLRSNSRVW